jgi:hypothetical protein
MKSDAGLEVCPSTIIQKVASRKNRILHDRIVNGKLRSVVRAAVERVRQGSIAA